MKQVGKMKYLITLIVGILIGWCLTLCFTNREANIEAKKQFMQTDAYNKLKSAQFMDSINKVLDREQMDENIKESMEQGKKQAELIELASQYNEFSSEGMAKRIVEIVSHE